MISQVGASGEEPPKNGETGLFALIVYVQGGLPAVDLVSLQGIQSQNSSAV